MPLPPFAPSAPPTTPHATPRWPWRRGVLAVAVLALALAGTYYLRHQTQLNRYARRAWAVGSSRVDLQACKLEYSIVSPK